LNDGGATGMTATRPREQATSLLDVLANYALNAGAEGLSGLPDLTRGRVGSNRNWNRPGWRKRGLRWDMVQTMARWPNAHTGNKITTERRSLRR